MQITRNSLDTSVGPSDRFTGTVYVDTVAAPAGGSQVIRPGDRVFFEPGEEHWHGAHPSRLMTHIAMLQVDSDGKSADWLAHVADREYGSAPPISG